MCLLSDDRIVAVDNDNKSVKLLDVTTGHVLHRLQLRDEPFGVCQLSGDRVAVTLPDTCTDMIQVYFVTFIIIT